MVIMGHVRDRDYSKKVKVSLENKVEKVYHKETTEGLGRTPSNDEPETKVGFEMKELTGSESDP